MVVRGGGPGLHPLSWYIIEEKLSMPDVITEIEFNGTVGPALEVGQRQRMHIEGIRDRRTPGVVDVINYAIL